MDATGLNVPAGPASPAEAAATDVVRRLQAAGHVAYFAGGCVRDRLMGRTPHDFDVATSARPEQVLGLFPRSQKVGIAFGVVLVRPGKGANAIEVATFRTDGAYADGRHPDSVTFTTAEHDARRRDFTCNGLFLDPITGTIHDYVGGRQDIQTRTLRAIGDPAKRFAEDHLRLLRAVRFAAKLDFEIEPATLAVVGQLAGRIGTVSRERVGEEVRMMLEHPTRLRAARLLQSSGLLRHVWPAALLDAATGFPFLANLQGGVTRATAVAAVQLGMAIPAPEPEAAVSVLRDAFVLSNEEAAEVTWLLQQSATFPGFMDFPVARAKRLLADGRFPALWQVWHLMLTADVAGAIESRIAALKAEGVNPPPLVSGNDLQKLGAVPGPAFKPWLEGLYDRQLEGEFLSREDALAAAEKLIRAGPQ